MDSGSSSDEEDLASDASTSLAIPVPVPPVEDLNSDSDDDFWERETKRRRRARLAQTLHPQEESHALECKTCRASLPRELFKDRRGQTVKNCAPCRAKQKTYRETYHRKHPDAAKRSQAKYNATENARAKNAKHRKSDKWKATRQRHKETDRFKETTKAYRESDRWKEVRAAEYKRVHSDPGRHLEHYIGIAMGKMLKGIRGSSKTVMSYSEFIDTDDLRDHFESQFESWMTWENYGKASKDGVKHWNVGHVIARVLYDANDGEDVRRCWSKKNLFPQDANENASLQTKLPAEDVLNQMKECWPVKWGGVVPGGI